MGSTDTSWCNIKLIKSTAQLEAGQRQEPASNLQLLEGWLKARFSWVINGSPFKRRGGPGTEPLVWNYPFSFCAWLGSQLTRNPLTKEPYHTFETAQVFSFLCVCWEPWRGWTVWESARGMILLQEDQDNNVWAQQTRGCECVQWLHIGPHMPCDIYTVTERWCPSDPCCLKNKCWYSEKFEKPCIWSQF